jgi:hypothetical protein
MRQSRVSPMMLRIALATLAFILMAFLWGCGGDFHIGQHPLYVAPHDSAFVAYALDKYPLLPERGLIAPVGARFVNESFIIVDVLVALLLNSRPFTQENIHADLVGVFNGLAIHDAADGHGLRVSHSNGEVIPLIKIPSGKPTVLRQQLVDQLQFPTIETARTNRMYAATVFPVMIQLNQSVHKTNIIYVSLCVERIRRYSFGVAIAGESIAVTMESAE